MQPKLKNIRQFVGEEHEIYYFEGPQYKVGPPPPLYEEEVALLRAAAGINPLTMQGADETVRIEGIGYAWHWWFEGPGITFSLLRKEGDTHDYG